MKTKLVLLLSLTLLCAVGAPPPIKTPATPQIYMATWPAEPPTQAMAIARILLTARCGRCESNNLRIVRIEVKDIVAEHKGSTTNLSVGEFDFKCRGCGNKWSRDEVISK